MTVVPSSTGDPSEPDLNQPLKSLLNADGRVFVQDGRQHAVFGLLRQPVGQSAERVVKDHFTMTVVPSSTGIQFESNLHQ